MASIEQRGNTCRVVFRYGGEKYARSLRTTSEKAANANSLTEYRSIRFREDGFILFAHQRHGVPPLRIIDPEYSVHADFSADPLAGLKFVGRRRVDVSA